ncbi:Hpt domain-containing protein [Faecalicatena sp. AGMB00832]|uniref:Hpt domain-containing protein n=1 Tax=Faecalicatena faecalis TaxID=2726362 RepID=A0ABS6D389_9FIRM|nr:MULTISPECIES: Hpt domain-containing protein [Faecalicatena]MBU3876048.1 Hpt domain-containing protein [Faecalicatena faecalis]MCI6468283.1 Hpt domain-containing protein [Faecalicatena sp.]MDY5620537.1 Hpt domain-containing protein [Lachnospiraceae bacterium]
MSQFRTIFEAYGGDYQATMARFVNKEDMYLKFLDMLFQDDNMQKLGEALEAGNMKSAFEAAHTLKGVVGNMGLAPLFTSVCTILEPLRAGEERSDYQEMYEVIKDEFQKADDLRVQLKKGE